MSWNGLTISVYICHAQFDIIIEHIEDDHSMQELIIVRKTTVNLLFTRHDLALTLKHGSFGNI